MRPSQWIFEWLEMRSALSREVSQRLEGNRLEARREFDRLDSRIKLALCSLSSGCSFLTFLGQGWRAPAKSLRRLSPMFRQRLEDALAL